ncbi:DUF3180 domain-containing protein [Oerskovia flava]|uniref:DUF3180 domain-containing protein n=1 Tax=Oerskovia flava TaxID=2986422 RepID=UPI00223F51FF|nr:DUF3180 domain-containing protein [Oerskovia sp. JB1-3-2]
MRRTAVATLVRLLLITTLLSWVAVWSLERRGTYLPVVPWVVDVTLLALAGAILWAGWAVRSYQQGRRPSLDPLRAARTLVLAKAASLTGALLAGWYLAQVLVVLGDLAIDARRDRATAAGAAVVCAVVLTVVGMVVEKFCELPGGTDGDGPGGASGAESPDAPLST